MCLVFGLYSVSVDRSALLFIFIESYNIFFLCLPTACFCISQELVSIGTEGRSGDLTVLGNVKHKMVCSPDFEALLEGSA